MAFKPSQIAQQPDFSSLFTSLSNSKTQVQNYSLYQTIFFLITNTAKARDLLLASVDTINEQISEILAASFLTVNDETADFPNSRQLLAGVGITFDDSVPGERTVNASASSMVPMSTGAEPLEIMSNGAGQVLLIGFDNDGQPQ